MEESTRGTEETRPSKMEGDQMEEEPKKKVRHRKKLLITKIRSQLEFYFSAANLSKDKFMKGLLKDSPYIDLEIFFKFNRVRCMTDDINLLKKAIQKSQVLQLSDDGLRVKRFKAAKMKENETNCTIYVENIPSHVDNEWVHDMFAQYGTIDYISFPRFKNTGRPKGFAFIEFQTPEMANIALESFGALGCTIAADIEPSQLQSIRTHEGEGVDIQLDSFSSGEYAKKGSQHHGQSWENGKSGNRAEGKAMVDGNGDKESTCQEKRKRKEDMNDKDNKGKATDDENDSGKTNEDHTKKKKKKVKVADSEKVPKGSDSVIEDENKVVESGDVVEKNKGDKETKKRKIKTDCELENVIKKVRREVDEEKELEKSNAEDAEGLQAQKKRPLDESEKERVKKSKKQKVMADTTNTSASTEVDEKVRPTALEETPVVKKKKKKKRKRNKKEKGVASEGISLKVMSKQEWTRLRNRYLNMQKKNMESLKYDLQKRREAVSMDYNDDRSETLSKTSMDYTDDRSDASQKTKPQFIPNAVIKISFEEPPQDPKKLQEAIKEGGRGGVAYVETSAVEKDVYVRFFSADSASAYLKGGVWSRMKLLTSEEEREYWNHCLTSWQNRRNKKNKHMKGTSQEYPSKFRGREKLLQKAMKEAQNSKPKSTHMVFED